MVERGNPFGSLFLKLKMGRKHRRKVARLKNSDNDNWEAYTAVLNRDYWVRNSKPAFIGNGLKRYDRQDRAELWRKKGHNYKYVYKAEGLNSKFLNDNNLNNIGLKISNSKISKELLAQKILNPKDKPFKHFC